MRGRKLALTLFGLMLAVPAVVPARAATQAQTDAVRQLCRSDYISHCSNVPTGGSAAFSCLQQNSANLSAPCKEAMAAVVPVASQTPAPKARSTSEAQHVAMKPGRRQVAMLTRACKGDFQAYCSDIQPGGGRGLECLMAHRPQLSSGCGSALSQMRGSH